MRQKSVSPLPLLGEGKGWGRKIPPPYVEHPILLFLYNEYKMKTIKYFSTFSGIGGFELGINNAASSTGVQIECIGHSEIDKFAESVYQNHYKENKNYGDITKIKTTELPDFDILVGGFPCQSYSSAGKQKGLGDERGQLFYDLVRIIREKQPKVIVLENVPALLSNNRGHSFATILAELEKLGMYAEWQVCDSSHFGVPQTRKRLIIVGFLGKIPTQPIFPLHPTHRTRLDEDTFISYSQTRDSIKLKDTANTIVASYSGLGNFNQPAILTDNKRIRRLTPLECERLMGFPDNWTGIGADGKLVSDSQRYHQCGNAVCPNVIEAVFDKIFSINNLF